MSANGEFVLCVLGEFSHFYAIKNIYTIADACSRSVLVLVPYL